MSTGQLTVTKAQLHAFLEVYDEEEKTYEDNDVLSSIDDRLWLCQLDYALVVAATEVSEHSPGGEEYIEIAVETAKALQKGYTLITWYGENAECLIVGIRPEQLVITD